VPRASVVNLARNARSFEPKVMLSMANKFSSGSPSTNTCIPEPFGFDTSATMLFSDAS
jgi:hypothetical protein